MPLIFIGFLNLLLSINIYAGNWDYDHPEVNPLDSPTSWDDYSDQTYTDSTHDAFVEPNDHYASKPRSRDHDSVTRSDDDYYYDMPSTIAATGEKMIIINPNIHAWGAYSQKGELLQSGLATAGSTWCSDIGRPCKTSAGTFRIKSLGNENCVSSIYPIGEGGAPMPYCMFFNGGQGLHGSNQVVAANISHGCVRLRETDARWIRYHFATVGTKVIIKPY